MLFCFVLLCQNHHRDNPDPKGFQTNTFCISSGPCSLREKCVLGVYFPIQSMDSPCVPVHGLKLFSLVKRTFFTEENVFSFESLLKSVFCPVAD